MSRHSLLVSRDKGFTIVELIIVVVVIAILVGIVILGYGGWRNETTINVLNNDLRNAKSAMDSARNFGNGSGYPTSLPSNFVASPNDNLTYAYGDPTYFCIQAVSTQNSSLSYYLNTQNNNNQIQSGHC